MKDFKFEACDFSPVIDEFGDREFITSSYGGHEELTEKNSRTRQHPPGLREGEVAGGVCKPGRAATDLRTRPYRVA